MSTISFVAIAIITLLASIVYEFTVVDRFIADQKLKQQLLGFKQASRCALRFPHDR
jgi:hypothetical protein